MKLIQKGIIGLGVLTGAAAISYAAQPALADSASPHYQLQETQLGGAGFNSSASANFQAAGTSAVLGVGTSIGSQYQIQAGHQTTNDPALTFAITSPSVSFSAPFSAASTSTATATFQVLDYTSYGYTVQIFGSPPNYSSDTIAALASPAQPSTGQDQFGINLVANTSPISFGHNPEPVPDSTFSYGEAHSNYNTPNYYMYNSGDIIADGPKSSGLTDYTISFIVNVKSITTAGQYTSPQTLLCIPTY